MSGVLTVLGCGGSAGVPRIGNDWGVCDPLEPRNVRTRPSIMVQNGPDTILVDTGADFRFQANRENVTDVSAVFYTHMHADHVNGIDDLRQYYYRTKKKIDVFSTAENMTYLHERFDYMFKDIMPYYPRALEPHTWVIEDLYKPQLYNGTSFTVFEQDHEGMVSLGFRFGDVAYSTDMVNLDQKALNVLKGVKVWIADGNSFYQEHGGPHATRTKLDELNAQIGAATIYITHLKNNLDYRTLCRELPAPFRCAFDGLRIQLDGTVLNDDAR